MWSRFSKKIEGLYREPRAVSRIQLVSARHPGSSVVAYASPQLISYLANPEVTLSADSPQQ